MLVKNKILDDLVREMETSQMNRDWNTMVTGRQGGSQCSKHRSPLDAYCCTDNQVICAACATEEHTGHTIGLVKEERRRKQDEVRNLKIRCQECLRQQERKLSHKAKLLEEIQEKARETNNVCEAILTRVIGLLQTHYMSLRELVRGQEEVAIQTLERRKEEVKMRCTALDRLAHTDSDVHFLLEWPTLRQLCEKDLHKFTDSLLPAFESIQKGVEHLGNQLEELCDSGFATINQTAAGLDQRDSDEVTEEENMQESNEDSYEVVEICGIVTQPAEPKSRDDFLKYACELTMDPSTAHEDLLLSPNKKEVKLAPPTIKGPAVRYPERFLHRRQVLCKEGLQSECCYYEVEVTGGKAEIALTYKGIDRKSRSKLSAFGGNDNSWSLDCSKHYCVSHKDYSVQLISVPRHKRIGVYLKFSEGTLCFYEVSDTMHFLYKIETSFTEALYPGFWVGDKCCIKICDLKSTASRLDYVPNAEV